MKYGKKNCGHTSAASGTELKGITPPDRRAPKAGWTVPKDPGKTTYKR